MKRALVLLGIVVAGFQMMGFRQTVAAEVVGEAFGTPVTDDEFAYHYKTASLFSRSGKEQRSDGETREEAWQNLIVLKEADRLDVKVSREELKAELTRLISQKGIEYGTLTYRTWVKVTFADEVQQFERRLEDLLRINKLIQEKMQPEVSVSEEEIREKYLNQYNSFESEYIRFDTPEQAQEFLKAVQKEPRLWKEAFDRKKAAAGQKGAAWLNVMSLEALIDLWKIPREDAYRFFGVRLGDFVVAKNYYGDCVFRLLYKRPASLQELDDKKKEYYRNGLTMMKRQQSAKSYFDDLLKRASYKDYEREKRQAREKTTRAAAIEKLKEKTIVHLETTKGPIELRLFPEVAPKACENFITLVERGFYNGLLFHRVKKEFMIQGGDPTGTGTGGESIWGEPFEDEVNDTVTFDRPGLLGMANSGPKTNKSQFFITTVPTPWLNKRHTIFGEVISGLEVVQQIENSPINEQDKPLEDQKILKASIQKPLEKEKNG